nr:hypothetical protein BaRGS_033367 [Batillaria attramentaria]
MPTSTTTMPCHRPVVLPACIPHRDKAGMNRKSPPPSSGGVARATASTQRAVNHTVIVFRVRRQGGAGGSR